MLRSIISALVSALKGGFRMLGRVATAPFRMLAGLGGGGLAVPPELPEVEPPAEDVAPVADRMQMYEDLANAVMAWAADALIADRPVPLPPRMPVAVREWLPGLSREECWTLMEAEKRAAAAHLEGIFHLDGVRRVQRLARVEDWPAAPVETKAAGLAAIALSLEPSPS